MLLKEGWAGVCRLIGEELEREETPPRRAALDRMPGYFVGQIGQLDCAGRLAACEAIGSGEVEGAAKTSGLLLKARRRHKNARAMTALICCRPTDPW